MSTVKVRVVAVQEPRMPGEHGFVSLAVGIAGAEDVVFDLPMPERVDASNYVKIARHFLHLRADLLASETAGWKMGNAELAEIGFTPNK